MTSLPPSVIAFLEDIVAAEFVTHYPLERSPEAADVVISMEQDAWTAFQDEAASLLVRETRPLLSWTVPRTNFHEARVARRIYTLFPHNTRIAVKRGKTLLGYKPSVAEAKAFAQEHEDNLLTTASDGVASTIPAHREENVGRMVKLLIRTSAETSTPTEAARRLCVARAEYFRLCRQYNVTPNGVDAHAPK